MRNELYHFGIKGMKWGIRRYQNPDGSLTEAGKRRQYKQERREFKRKLRSEKAINMGRHQKAVIEELKKERNADYNYSKAQRNTRNARLRKDMYDAANSYTRNSYATRKMAEQSHKDYWKARGELSKKRSEYFFKYVDKYRNATLKDMGFSNVKKGQQALEKYDMMRGVSLKSALTIMLATTLDNF